MYGISRVGRWISATQPVYSCICSRVYTGGETPDPLFWAFSFCDYGVFSVPQAIWRFSSMGVPQNAWLILDNPMEMDDLGAPL